MTTLPDAKAAAIRRAQIGFVFQSFNLLFHLTALENVTLAAATASAAFRARRSTVDHRHCHLVAIH
ncbi:hypothetical protein [Amycolatopsis sp. NPDC051071]|uniref:hypothetical protein n=1 Tax=Amycolatopsis sp. NPDC051071 TaxID=3154637 RepID=UPI00343B4CD8